MCRWRGRNRPGPRRCFPGRRPTHLPSPAQRAGYSSTVTHNRANGPAVCAMDESQTYRWSISMPCFLPSARYSFWNDVVDPVVCRKWPGRWPSMYHRHSYPAQRAEHTVACQGATWRYCCHDCGLHGRMVTRSFLCPCLRARRLRCLSACIDGRGLIRSRTCQEGRRRQAGWRRIS